MDVIAILQNFSPNHLHILKDASKNYKNLLVKYNFYRRIQALNTIMIGIRGVMTLFNYEPPSYFYEFSRLFLSGTSPWTIFYFGQLLPVASFFIISVQAVFGVMTQFFFMYLSFLFRFAAMFQMSIT